MIALVQDTTQGYVIVIPQEYVEAWGLTQDTALEVHRINSTHEEDEPAAIDALGERVREIHARMMVEHDGAFRELAKGPKGLGPHEPAPFDLRRW